MNDASVENIHIQGQEHWTKKGDAKLFLWEKRAPRTARRSGTILFVHGSSMASQPTFDLQVPGRPGAMDYFVGQGFDTWSVDMEGYGRSTKDRGIDATIADGADDLKAAHRLHLQDPQPHRPAAGVRHLVRRAARGAVRPAPSRTGSSGSRSTPMSGPAKAARRWSSAARSCRNSSRPSAGRSTASSCARSSSATIPAPPTTT